MADWYVSSVAYAALPQWQASHAYTVGNIIRPLTASAFQYASTFRSTVAGTSGSTEPNWASAPGNNNTLTDGGVTWANVAGQGAYGWGAAAPTLFGISSNSGGGARAALGDRIFLSSDHTETNAAGSAYALYSSAAFGCIQVISVNRGGSVPPAPADATSGANITATGTFYLDAISNEYWQGVTFTLGGAANLLYFNYIGLKEHYFKNCAVVFATSNATAQLSSANPAKVIFDNTTVSFNNASQRFNFPAGYGNDFTWINTPAAIPGTVPTTLFINPSSTGAAAITCRGVDLSAVNTTLLGTGGSGAWQKLLLDSCRINPSVVRLAAAVGTTNAADEVELVNCYDGTNTNINERHTPAGDVTTNRSTTLIGGAQDDVGLYSLRLVSSTRSDDFAMTLDSFWMDVELTAIGNPRTATVEIVSSASLNNNDIRLQLEYLGTSGSSLASFGDTFANALTTVAAVPTSTASWNSPPSTPVYQHLQVTFTPQQAGRLRGLVRLGKVSTTVFVNPQIVVT